MSGDLRKDINASFAVRTVKKVIKMYTTLSDRLKQAGIKENKSKSPGKGSKNNKNSKRNKKTQKCYSKAHVSSTFQRPKKCRKPLRNSVAPSLEKSLPKEQFQGESLFERIPEGNGENDEKTEKGTIFVSLDFIEECQNYKKKVRTPKDEPLLRNQLKRGLKSTSSSQKEGSDTRESSLKSAESMEVNTPKDKTEETGEANPDVTEKLQSGEKDFSEVLHSLQPFLKEPSSENVAKIDKKYLDSIISLASKMEANKKTFESDSSVKLCEPKTETKKKLTGKDYYEMKLKTKETLGDDLRRDGTTGRVEDDPRDTSDSHRNDSRIVRDHLTKSEEQIQLKKGKNLFDTYNTSKAKNLTHSKPDINDIDRKRRRTRPKSVKNKAKEFVETSLPSEVSRAADVTELWRRKTLLKKSENSLTSHSSCTVPETDEYPQSKNLESYKILKKLVEEEITHISKKPESRNNTGEVKTKESNNPGKQTETAKKPPPCRKTTNELSILKRRLLQAEGKLDKSELLSFLGDDVPKEANLKLEDKTKSGKIPSKIIENWSILNRLEQAFLGLGTPTFPDKLIKTTPKEKHVSGKDGSTATTEKTLKDTKRVQKHRDVRAKRENKVSTTPKNPPKPVKKKESEHKLKEEQKEEQKEEKTQPKPKKLGKQEVTERKAPKPEETNARPKKKKLLSRQERTMSRKQSLSLITRNLKREPNNEPLSSSRLYMEPKCQKMAKKKPGDPPRKLSQENLERKKTFDVIPGTEESTVQPRKSKSCGINQTNLERRFSQRKILDGNVFSKDDQKIQRRRIQNDGVTKIMPPVPKRLAKNPIKGTTTCEQPSKMDGNIKPVLEKDCFGGNYPREASMDRSTEDKEVKNQEGTEEHSKDMMGKDSEKMKDKLSWSNITVYVEEVDNRSSENESKKGVEDNAKERPMKKRSFLSVHMDQHCDQTPRKLLQIKEKESSSGSLEKAPRDVQNAQEEPKTNSSNCSSTSTETVHLIDLSNQTKKSQTSQKQPVKLDISQRLTTSSLNDSIMDDDDDEEDPGEPRTRKQQPLWEQDMAHYRAIVREIMSQYKRIDGFLKQNEHLNNFTNDNTSLGEVSNVDSSNTSDDSQVLSIHEYRKKIISEYKELPIFEYKSKMEQNKDGNYSEFVRKRNLLVVKDFNTDADDDVKDYQPKIQKVLDSQLYVDTERLVRRNESTAKIGEKISSLQDMVLRKKEAPVYAEDWHRSSSTPKTCQPQRSYVILPSVYSLASEDNSVDIITSESTTSYCQETETESIQLPSCASCER